VNWLAIITGALFLGAAVTDLMLTAFGVRGGGPLSRMVGQAVWSCVIWTHHRLPDNMLVRFAGLIILLFMAAVWIALELAGATLLLHGSDTAVRIASSDAPAGSADRLYFAGAALTTLGTGDVVAGSPAWRLVSIGLALSGFVSLTLTVAYFIPLLDAVISERRLATLIASLGPDPQQVLIDALDNEGDIAPLADDLRQLQPMIARFAIAQHAFPAVHYFRAGSPAPALAPSIARLDEVFLLAEAAGLPRDQRARRTVEQTRHAVGGLVDALGRRYVRASHHSPPLSPSDDLAARLGVDSLHDAVAEVCERHDRRRRVLLRYLRRDGRDWTEVTRMADDPDALGAQEGDEASEISNDHDDDRDIAGDERHATDADSPHRSRR
jgi:hypothetical protein